MARERAHPTGQLDLPGVRFATCQETDDGRRLDVAAVKRLTGGDTIRARKMRQDCYWEPDVFMGCQCVPVAAV